MIILLLILIITRPFICSVAFPQLDFIYSVSLFCFLASWIYIKKNCLWTNRTIAIAFSLFLTALAISILSSANKTLSALTLFQYLNGMLLFLVCQSLSCADKNKTILTIIFTAVFISLLNFNQFFLGFPNVKDYLSAAKISDLVIENFLAEQRAFSPFITPNTLGGYLIMVIPLALTLKDNAWIVLPLFLALLLSKSVGAIVCLLAAAILFFFAKRKLTKDSLIILLIVALLIGLFTMAIALFVLREASPLHHFQPDYSMKMRLGYWLQTLLVIKSHLLTGTGLGNFELVNSRYAHNTALQLWAETGLLGISSFIFLIITLLRASFNALKTNTDTTVTAGLFCGSLAFLIHNSIDFTFYLPETAFIWCAILGLLLNNTRTSSRILQ